MLKSKPFALAAGALPVIALAAAAVILSGSDDPELTSVGDSAKYITDNRDRIAICVQSEITGAAFEAEAKRAVESAVLEVSQDALWMSLGLSPPPPTVTEGCPSRPGILSSEVPAVKQPSYYRVHVFVMSRTNLQARFSGQRIRRSAEEKVCGGDFCAEVTTGIYLAPEELTDGALVSEALRYGIGLK